MIQRIQSILLALVAVGIALLFKFPMATYVAEPGVQSYTVTTQIDLVAKQNPAMLRQIEAGGGSVYMDQSTAGIHMWPMIVIALAVAALSLGCIFLYKNRILQMRLVSVAFLLNVIYVGLLFLWCVDSYGKTVAAFAASLQCGPTHTVYAAGTWIPIITMGLLFLAQRAIRRDELKVRAADRLR